MRIQFARPQDDIRKPRVMDAVRELLGFEGKGAAILDGIAVLIDGLAVPEEIAAVELQAGLVGEDLQEASAMWLIDSCIQYNTVTGLEVEHPVMVVSVAEVQLLIVGIYPLAYRVRLAEIKRAAVK